jgi:tetratricopeptide (TPR) repeat protein
VTGRVGCYVSTPFGTKPRSEGGLIDHDQIYQRGVRPALEGLGLEVIRADEMSGAIVMKSVFDALVSSDVMIADITGGNPNVMYELGVRHALRRGVTVMIMAAGAHIPYNISYSPVVSYELDFDGRLRDDAADSLRDALSRIVREALVRITIDSPVYQFYPNLAVDLPVDLVSAEARRGVQPQLPQDPTSPAAAQDPLALINELRRLRDASAWEELVRFAATLPPDVANAPEAIQVVALALNRLGRQDEAIASIQSLIDETGGDAESYGILGRIYKDRHRRTEDPKDLDAAIRTYQTGFEMQPSEFYPGMNALALRVSRNSPDDQREISTLLPRVRRAVESRLSISGGDYWTVASALELACIDRDWETADALVSRVTASQVLSPWMIDSTAAQLSSYSTAMNDSDQRRLENVLLQLQGAARA